MAGPTARRRKRPPMVRARDPWSMPRRPTGARYPPPAPERLVRRRADRRRGAVAWPARVLLVAALLALGAAVAVAGAGLLRTAIGDLGATVAAIFQSAAATPSPSPVILTAPDAPRLVVPVNDATNLASWVVRGFVPANTNPEDYKLRIYVNGQVATEVPAPGTLDFQVAVPIPAERSQIVATIVGPGGESTPSNAISVFFDDTAPALQIVSPKEGSTINDKTVTVSGATQAGSTVSVRNQANGASASAVAGPDGAFSIDITVAAGPNALTVTAVDPAGNSRSQVVNVIGGSGTMSANLTLSQSTFLQKSLPSAIGMTVEVLDPGGKPLDGARVTFNLLAPGLAPVTFEQVSRNGLATWNTKIPAGATTGLGQVIAHIETDKYGTRDAVAPFRIS